MKSDIGLLLALSTSVAACASPQIDPKALTAAVRAVEAQDLASMDCDALRDTKLGLGEQAAGAIVKPTAVDFTNPADLAKVKELNPGQTALSVAMTTAKSSVPGAGFAPLITGSARRQALRTTALNEADKTLAKLDGVMLAKACDAITSDDETPTVEAAPAASEPKETEPSGPEPGEGGA